jgi:glycerol-3-phosphate dehydrogenase
VIRDLARLAEREFDVLVVGGGIYGLTIAYDAAQRGLSVALIDRGDFGAATSFNHLKTIHGGLRYLQSADFQRMRESIHERRAFARIAPRWIAPQAFAIPTGASLTRNPIAMRAALALDALVGRDRNEGVDPGRHLPAGRIVAGTACRDLFDAAIRGVASAAVWYDYQTVDGDRLTLSFAKGAAAHGAALANYVEAIGALKTGQRATGVQARDTLSGQAFDIRSRMVVNAAGPWAATLFDQSAAPRWPLLKAMNLVTSRPARKAALVGATHAGRALVMLPWQGRTLVGTSESSDLRQPDDQEARRGEVDAFLADVNETFPALGLKPEEVTLVHRGIVPAAEANGRISLLAHSRIIDHAEDGRTPELISIAGVKYTTARAVAERAVDLILRKLGRSAVACRTASTVLPESGLDDRAPADPIAHAVRDEMAQTLSDVVIRRTGLGATGKPADSAINDVASRMQNALGWLEQRKSRELEALTRFYEIS